MAWDVEYTDQFGEWWDSLTEEQQDTLKGRVDLLAESGPRLGRPVVETITRSEIHNLKELRASKGGALRVLFVFDPLSHAVLLIGGNKTGRWNAWYAEMIPVAEALYAEHLNELRDEGELP